MSMNGNVVTGWQSANAHAGTSASGRGYGGAGAIDATPVTPRSHQHLNGRIPASPVIDNSAVNVGQMQDSRRILAAFPFASATPSAHVTRHLSNLTISAQAPSYFDSNCYSTGTQQSPYAEYAEGLAHLSGPTVPNDPQGREYWTTARDDTLRLLGNQSTVTSQTQYSTLSQWNQSPASSSFQSTALGASVMQHMTPHSAYPTPPPPNMSSSSSSLANALGGNTGASERKMYQPEESTKYFNQYLDGQKKSMNIGLGIRLSPQKRSSNNAYMETPPTTPALPQQQQQFSSPLSSAPSATPMQTSSDPLAVISSPLTPLSTVTPQKRKLKPEVLIIESPTKKRGYAYSPSFRNGNYNGMATPPPPSSPSLSRTNTGTTGVVTPTTGKKKIVPYVEITTPTNGWWNQGQTPTKNSSKLTSDDLGGYGSEDGLMSPNRSAKRTGDRAPLEKLESLFEDIRQAEDNVSDMPLSDIPSDFFSPLTFEVTAPLLHPNLIRKLTKHISNVARPTKRLRLATWDNLRTPGRNAGMSELATEMLSRILKSLERSVKAGEDLEPFFGAPRKAAAPTSTKGGKKKKGEKKSKKDAEDGKRSKSPQEAKSLEAEGGEPEEESHQDSAEPTGEDFDKLETLLETARDSVLAADCCIALLGSDRLDKQLYSEDLITSCLATVKNQLTKIVYPFVETGGAQGNISVLMHYIISPSSQSPFDTSAHRRLIGELFQAICSIFPRIYNLVCADVVAMSESIIIPAVYIAIGPFFVADNGQPLTFLGNNSMRALRTDALSLIRNIFANYESQRSWIIEEILSSLIKLSDTKQKAGQFRLRDGRSIRTVSALLLQLVQSSAHNVRIEARRIAKARRQQLALRRQESFNGENETDNTFLDDRDLEEIRMYSTGLEAPSKAAKTIVLFLTQRSGKSKSTKNTNEAEYRNILDNLISDLLVILFWPEWPAASLVLSILCKFMVASLDDIKSATQNDNNASKALALDHLGVIAGRLRGAMLKFERIATSGSSKEDGGSLKSIDEIMSGANERQLSRLIKAHNDLSSYLSKRSSEDQAFESARELTAIVWGQELAGVLNQCNAILSDDDNDHPDPKVQHRNIESFGENVKFALRDVWTDAPNDVFDSTGQEEIVRIDKIAEELGTVQNLKNAFEPILNVILLALDAPPVFMRTKALRALSQILSVDPSVLSNPSVRRAIESHLLDSSPAVRDAAVELIGKYMIDSPTVAGDYYQKIAERIADTGLGVRKRVVKLLKSYYGITSDIGVRIDICTKLVLRMLDEDETVKDLAAKTLEELWFSISPSSTSKMRASSGSPENRAQLLAKVSVIMGVSGNFKDRQSPLEDVLHKIVSNAENADALNLKDQYTELCDLMIDGLLDASDLPGFTVINCIKTVHLLVSAYPPIVSASKASTLLPYLKNPTSAEEQIISDYILKIFRTAIPHMPKTAAKFGQDVQLVLQPMVLKPSPAAGLAALQETVACLCVVVRHLTHDFTRLVALLKSCNGRIDLFINRPTSAPANPQDLRALTMVVFIVSLLGEHSDFDKIRSENEAVAAELCSVTQGSVVSHVYNRLLRLYERYSDSAFRGRLLQCLGFLFRAQPTLMTLDSSATMMDAIFVSPEEENRGRLLKIMQDFLVSESSKHLAQEKEKEIVKVKAGKSNINMEELVGNTLGFAESGVSSAIVQRYLREILEAALSQNPSIQSSAVDILSFTIKQGLAHPLQSFPVIIALETSPITSLSTRANALHSILHSKHASLLNAGYVKAVRASFDYQRRLGKGGIQGFRLQPAPTALLHRWYSLIREKRVMRQDFLKAIVRVFDVDNSFKTSQDDIEFTRYMAENLACFDYKTQEEVLTIIKYLTSVLSTSGMQLIEILSPSHLLAQLRGRSGQSSQEVSEGGNLLFTANTVASKSTEERLMLMRTSVIVGIVMLLKSHLKTLYGLSEDKCQKWVPGKKNAIGDKLATKRRDAVISWDRMPFATEFLLTSQDMDTQQGKFLEIWNEDGATAEPETNEWE